MNRIDYDTIELTKKERRDVLIISTVMAAIIIYLYYSSLLLCVFAYPVSLFSLSIYKEYSIRRRKNYLVNQFRDLLYSLSASVAAGRHMKEALSEGKENLLMIYPEDSPMIAELEHIEYLIREANESEETLLYDLAARSGIKDIHTFAEVYSIARSTGADLVRVIGLTSQILIDKMTIVREIESYTAQKKFEGRVIAVMPPGIIFFLKVISPEYLMPLYSNLSGRILMTICLVMTISGVMIAERITDINIWDDNENKRLRSLTKRSKNRKGKQREHHS